MTADERIELLLNRFGQTIEDLPKSADNDWSDNVYESRHLISAKKAALVFMMDEWQDTDAVPEIKYEVEECLLDYICHLADIIDRMEIALETAAKCVSCIPCVNAYSYCNGSCDFRIDDKYMSDVSEKDTKRYIGDAE